MKSPKKTPRKASKPQATVSAVPAKTDPGSGKRKAVVKVKATPPEPAQPPASRAATPPPSPSAQPQPKRPKPAPTRDDKSTRAPAPQLPPLLLEDDPSNVPAASGPGRRYVQPVSSPSTRPPSARDRLPESYGTGSLFLTARDPHWLYVYWDLSREQRERLRSTSGEGSLALRIYIGTAPGGSPLSQVQLPEGASSWFVFVGQSSTPFVGELGWLTVHGEWSRIASSRPTLTPPDRSSEDTSAQFMRFPPQVSFEQVVEVVKDTVSESVPLMEAVRQLREEGHRDLPAEPCPAPEWTPAQAEALAAVVTLDSTRQVWIGSLEITELVRRHLQQDVSSVQAARWGPALERPLEGAQVGISSALVSQEAKPQQERQFWFQVNAELVIYGATEPDARVTLAGRPLALRPDGTFSLRFALPDGEYDLPLEARSADGMEDRSARLSFHRSTQLSGEVAAHPQDPQLKPPSSEDLS